MARPADAWKNLFDDRATSREWPYQSGVWSKHEWIHPRIEIENIVSLGEGNTPLRWMSRLGETLSIPELWFKPCWISPTGSLEDLGMTVLVSAVSQMKKDGEPMRGIACASYGDITSALAAYCAVAGIPAIVFLPIERLSKGLLGRPSADGVFILALDTDVEGCRQIARQVAADCSIYFASLADALRIEGEKTVAVELVQQLGWSVPDWIIVPSENSGSIRALGRGFLMMRELGLVDRLPRIVCVCQEKSNSLYQSYHSGIMDAEPIAALGEKAAETQIEAKENYEQAAKLLCGFNGLVEQTSQEELSRVAAVADQTGFDSCSRTQMALAALSGLLDRGEIHATDRVVVLAFERASNAGLHDRSSKDAWPCLADATVELPADSKAVAAWITHALDRREEACCH